MYESTNRIQETSSSIDSLSPLLPGKLPFVKNSTYYFRFVILIKYIIYYFQLERAAILQSIASPDGHENAELESELMAGKDIDHLMPTRYRNVKLSPTWYKSSSGKRYAF